MAMQRIHLPDEVRTIIETLEKRGYEAYAVGGCVRDSVLGKTPKDWDITTSAKPEEVKAVFPRCIDTGIQHGTVTVMLNGTGYEVTTFRVDGSYSDGRHPDSVSFTGLLSEDLKRRDFTINAMAYNERSGITDLFGGIRDLERGLVRAVGNPAERFTEDALRILRLVRFSARLDFDMEEETFRAARALSPRLFLVSAERIRDEWMKTLLSDHPEKILLFEELGALRIFFPELSEALSGGKSPDPILRLSSFPADGVPRLAAVFDFIRQEGKLSAASAKTLADRRLRALKYDNHTRETVCFLMAFSDRSLPASPKELRSLLSETGKDGFPLLLSFRRLLAEEETDFDAAERCFQGVLDRQECTSVRELAVNGNDLLSCGVKPGKELGKILKALLLAVLEDPGLNTKEALLTRAAELRADS